MSNALKIRCSVIAAVGMLVASCGGDGGGGGPGPTGPPPTASLSGFVREQGTSTPVSGAAITVGSIAATSGQNGEFSAQNVPIGAAINVAVAASGFETFGQNVAIQSGTNSLTVSLVRNGMYETDGFVIYLPPGISSYRGALLVMHGNGGDTRPLIRGNLAFYQAIPLAGDVAGYRQHMLELAQTHGLALIGGSFTTSDQQAGTYTRILQALVTVSGQSGRSELATAPVLVHGHSTGACLAYQFAVLHPTRVAGFISAKGICSGLDGSTAVSVPSLLVFGEDDDLAPGAAVDITRIFEANRARGALWAVAMEPRPGHAMVADQDMLFNWMSTVLTLRLPAATGGSLRTVGEASGWLANRTSFAIADYTCYSSDKLKASWLPTQQTARDWQKLVTSGAVTTVIPCP